MNKINSNSRILASEQYEGVLGTLEVRFQKNMNLHKDLEWSKLKTKLESDHEKLWSFYEMERTGGEPEVVDYDSKIDEYIFYDCSVEGLKAAEAFIATVRD